MIPATLVVRQLHLLDSYSSLVLPTMIDVFNSSCSAASSRLPTELYERPAWTAPRGPDPAAHRAPAVQVGDRRGRVLYGVGLLNDYFKGLFYLSGARQVAARHPAADARGRGNSPDAGGQSLATVQVNGQADLNGHHRGRVVPTPWPTPSSSASSPRAC